MPAHQASQLLTYGHSLTGVSASPGLTVGRLFQFRKASNVVLEWADPSALEKSVVHERAHLTKALQVATAQIQTIMASKNQSAEHAILHSHVQLMQDPDLWGLALQQIDLGTTAAFGWQSACTLQAQNFLNASSALLRDRANDVRDVGQRVLDVGCGTGLSLALLRAAVGDAGVVYGFDQSPEMLALARERVDGVDAERHTLLLLRGQHGLGHAGLLRLFNSASL